MTREQEILKIITNNPTIEQSEIAELLGITRSTVAVHITNLQKKGLLLGRGYIINQDKYVVGIGAANVDIYGKSKIEIREHFDHPAKIYAAAGGVTRNVCENYARLNGQVKLLAAFGDDVYGQMIIDKSKEAGIDVSNILKVKNQTSGIFLQMLDNNNDMHIALCDMSINEHLTKEYISSKQSLINGASAIILDPSLTNETIEQVLDMGKLVFLDTISDVYAKKIKPYLNKIYTIKCNKTEAQVLTGVKIVDDKSLDKAASSILKQGCKRVYISLGNKGAYYKDDKTSIKDSISPIKNPVNASGCGDAFFAATIFGYINGYDSKKTLRYGLAAGKIAIQSEDAINKKMSEKLIQDTLKGEKK